MELCPQCGKKLISHASARCNWCGKIIEDPNYQAQAAVNREAYLVEQAIHDAQRLSFNVNGVNGMGPFGDPIFGPMGPADPILAQQYAYDAAQRAAIRAQRLGPTPPAFPPYYQQPDPRQAPYYPQPDQQQAPYYQQAEPQQAPYYPQPDQQPADSQAAPSNSFGDPPGDESGRNRFGHLELE